MVSVRQTADALRAAGVEDAAYDARVLHELAAGDAAKLALLTQKRAARYPLQYLCGAWDFLDFTLTIGEGVLIPRADTEVVAEQAIAAAKAALRHTAHPRVADLCAGSGALAIGVARFVPQSCVTAVELSEAALAYLRQNAAALAQNVTVEAADVFAWHAAQPSGSYDVLVSNPPYITEQEMRTLAPELAFEHVMALEAPENGLAFYRLFARHCGRLLAPEGCLVLEIGSGQAEAVTALLQENGWQAISLVRDYAGLPRCIKACRPIDFLE